MSEVEIRASHLSEEEIDGYARRTLSREAEARVEQHYLACEVCHARVLFSEDLVAALAATRDERQARRFRRAWQVAAALLAVAGLVAAWQLAQPTGSTPQSQASTAARPEVVVRLAPPTRDGRIAVVERAAGTSVRLLIDAREGGAPGTPFEVTISTLEGESIYQASDLESSPTGELEVRIDGRRLPAGTYLLEARTEGGTFGLPFRVSE